MAKKTEHKDPQSRIRMIGPERKESIVVKLTQIEIDDQRVLVCDLRDKQDALEEELKSVKADYKARQEGLEEKERVARRLASTARAETEVAIQDWLTQGNEIISIRLDTGDVLRRRTATARELQEELPLDGGPPPQDDAFPGFGDEA